MKLGDILNNGFGLFEEHLISFDNPRFIFTGYTNIYEALVYSNNPFLKILKAV